MIEVNAMQHLDQVLGFKKDNPGISRGLDLQIWGFLHFFQKYCNEFLLFFCMTIEANTVQRVAAVLLSGSTSILLVVQRRYPIY